MNNINYMLETAKANVSEAYTANEIYFSKIISLKIETVDDVSLMGDYLKPLILLQKKLEEKRHVWTKPLNDVIKDVNATFKKLKDQIDLNVSLGKDKIAYFQSKQLRIKEEQQRLAQIKAEEEAKQAKEIEEKVTLYNNENNQSLDDYENRKNLADALEFTAQMSKQAKDELKKASKPVKIEVTRGNNANVSTKVTWKAEAVDIKAICLGIIEGRLPDDVIMINNSKLQNMARIRKTEMLVDGIKYYKHISASIL